ncbi:Putative ribonuclease H protein At1g65750 [Linum perenne]
MLRGVRCCIRDGRRTNFWTDAWLDSGVTLREFAGNNQGVVLSNSVSDFCLTNGAWDIPKLVSCLPPDLVLQVVGMTPPCPSSGDDALVWGLEDNGRFSVKSAYALIKDLRLDGGQGGWNRIWKWQGPNRIKHFMWITAQGKLMTNVERVRRHLSATEMCTACNHNVEDIDHVLRKCTAAMEVWNALLPEAVSQPALQRDFSEWWLDNIGNQSINPSFGVIAWLIWKRRNKLIFETVGWTLEEVRNQVKFWVLLLSSSWKAGQLGREVPSLARQTQLIGWRPGGEGWFTLNSDGSLYSHNNRAAAGGLIRDCEGKFISSYAVNLGTCSIMRAELRGIIEGMQ